MNSLFQKQEAFSERHVTDIARSNLQQAFHHQHVDLIIVEHPLENVGENNLTKAITKEKNHYVFTSTAAMLNIYKH